MNRNDLSEWIIHFVHRRNPENDPLEFSWDLENMDFIDFPDSFTYDGEPIYKTEKYQEDDYGLEPDAYAIGVLKKILYDGIIRTGWSFRNGKATIYGPKSATCFTEMPLYALIDYSKKRNNQNYIEPYGIAFLKEELFEAGARPVIYGLSGKHSESKKGDKNYGIGLRTLSKKSGIGLREMYRYVYTNINSANRIDWTHEREWRWADLDERFEWFAGLPFFAENEEFSFSKIIVFVKTKEEREDIIDHLQHLYHSMGTNFDQPYDLRVIANTYVLSIDELSGIEKDISTIKLDDLPLSSIPKMKKISVSKETLEKVSQAINRASKISYIESEKIFKKTGDNGLCGWAWVVTYVSNSEITQALVDLGLATSFGKGYYQISLNKFYPAQSLHIDEPGKIKAAEFLTKELGQNFSTHWKWD
nr:hypothetical protein [uncultured Allomuricauda sp.]